MFNKNEYKLFLTRLTFKELKNLYGFISFYGSNNKKEKLTLICEEIEFRRILEMR